MHPGGINLHDLKLQTILFVDVVQPVYLAVEIVELVILPALAISSVAVQGTDVADLVVADVPLFVKATVVIVDQGGFQRRRRG